MGGGSGDEDGTTKQQHESLLHLEALERYASFRLEAIFNNEIINKNDKNAKK